MTSNLSEEKMTRMRHLQMNRMKMTVTRYNLLSCNYERISKLLCRRRVALICLEPWTNSGRHRLCSLRCGHLFGRQCIDRWLAAGRVKCPQCNAPAKRRHSRSLLQDARGDGHGRKGPFRSATWSAAAWVPETWGKRWHRPTWMLKYWSRAGNAEGRKRPS